MKTPVLVLHAKGTNRDHDAAEAITLAGGAPTVATVGQVLAGDVHLDAYRMLVLPGGFSYGDDLGAGKVFALALRHGLRDQLTAFVEAGRPVLGICNGFQALIKAGLLPSADEGTWSERRPATLTYNASGHFECRWVELTADPESACIFTKGVRKPLYVPVAHGEGRVVARDEASLAGLVRNGQVALRYRSGYPANPNGSVDDIAGLCNAAGNVLGMMPHPEDHVRPEQHPRHHRGERGGHGLVLFENGVRHAAQL